MASMQRVDAADLLDHHILDREHRDPEDQAGNALETVGASSGCSVTSCFTTRPVL